MKKKYEKPKAVNLGNSMKLANGYCSHGSVPTLPANGCFFGPFFNGFHCTPGVYATSGGGTCITGGTP